MFSFLSPYSGGHSFSWLLASSLSPNNPTFFFSKARLLKLIFQAAEAPFSSPSSAAFAASTLL